MNAWSVAGLIYHLRNHKKWSWSKIGRATAVGLGYLVVGCVIAFFLPEFD